MNKYLVIIGYVDRGSLEAQVKQLVITAESKDAARTAALRSLSDYTWACEHVADDLDDATYDRLFDGAIDYFDVVAIDDINNAAPVATLPSDVEPQDPPDGMYRSRSIMAEPTDP